MASNKVLNFIQERRGVAVGAAVVVAVLVVGLIAWAALAPPANDPNHPEGTTWACKNGHTFNMSTKALGDHFKKHYGQPVPCPTCKAPAERVGNK